jgi:hypothetical protein
MTASIWTTRLRRYRVEILLFTAVLASNAYFCQAMGYHQAARVAQLRSVTEARTFAIDDYVSYGVADQQREILARRSPFEHPLWVTGDVCVIGSHVYPNKPPGMTLLGAPICAAILCVQDVAGLNRDARVPLQTRMYLTRVLLVGVSGAVAALLLLRESRRLFPEVPDRAHLAAVGVFALGTPMLPYSTMLYDHVPVAAILLGEFALVALPGERASARASFAAGALCGFGVVMNYLAAMPVIVLGAWIVRRGRPLWFVLGGLPWLVAILLYHTSCFGHPLTIAQFTSNDDRTPWNMLGGASSFPLIREPRLYVLWQLFFPPYRGLFYGSPVLLLSLVGLAYAWRPGRRAELGLAIAIVGAYLAGTSIFSDQQWHGGAGISARYLLPIVPFFALGLAPAFHRQRHLTWTLALVSTALMLLATAVNPEPYYTVQDPWADLWRYFTGPGPQVSVMGYGPWGWAFGADSQVARWTAFNMGELLWPESRLSVIPWLLLIAGAGAALYAWTRPNVTEP